MIDERLDRIEKMLTAVLRGTSHIHWIGGYVYGTTEDGGSKFIILYPASDRLKEKIVRVYQEEFKRLPDFIDTSDRAFARAVSTNPAKDKAMTKGIYHECPLFQIVTYDGRETQMGKERRFGDVVRVARPRQTTGPNVTVNYNPPPQDGEIDWDEKSEVTPKPAKSTEPVVTGGPVDYGKLALEADTVEKFDYSAYMLLQDEKAYTDQVVIGKTRNYLKPDWRPSAKSNRAMLTALKVYRKERGDGVEHDEAKSRALVGYSELMSN